MSQPLVLPDKLPTAPFRFAAKNIKDFAAICNYLETKGVAIQYQHLSNFKPDNVYYMTADFFLFIKSPGYSYRQDDGIYYAEGVVEAVKTANNPTDIFYQHVLTNEEVFNLFLRKHRKLTSFRKQFNKSRTLNTKAVKVERAILDSFFWFNTTEGEDFWVKLSHKWEKVCTQFKLSGTITLTKV